MLAVADLRFAYRGGPELFSGLTHEFAPGRVSVVTGASGRGKSTLLYLLGLLLRPSSGRVLVDGQPQTKAPDAARAAIRARKVGFVFQDAELDGSRKVVDSVLEPVLYAGEEPARFRSQAEELLAAFGLADHARRRPGQISGGQAQRVALCRALVMRPSVILADEPTGNLDPDNAAAVLETLCQAAADGRTVVIASHDPVVIGRADEQVAL